ncbi:hypothetical protein [Flavobacterium johnsoniae]|uniref:hypothetical protein n=1 Tax=Flavobacterium johnsoniae TaxID=986 RepID=UPI0011EDC84C|nr:hypothetical protein [Flavobacterium johnsoniae]
MDKVTFTRLELYNLVWKFPIIQIAKHYEISSMGIKNACEKMQIPLPGSKHWIRLNYERKSIPKLSGDYKGNSQISILRKMYESPLRKTARSTPLIALIESIESDSKAPSKVLEFLNNPSGIIRKTQNYWNHAKVNRNVSETPEEIIQLSVDQKNTNRALRFMDALIKLLEYRGHQFKKSNDNRDIILMHKEIEIDIHLREALKRIPPKTNKDSADYIFTGEFILQIKKGSYKKEWRDGKLPLENNLTAIVAKLELIAVEEKQWKEASF